MGGDFLRSDFVFEHRPALAGKTDCDNHGHGCSAGGVRYKRASNGETNVHKLPPSVTAAHFHKKYQPVFTHNEWPPQRNATANSVRISFFMTRSTGDMDRYFSMFPTLPDILYLNAGAWHNNPVFSCDFARLAKTVAPMGRDVVWGTFLSGHTLKCDDDAFQALPQARVLDRTQLPRTQLGASLDLGGGGCCHYAHLVNLHDSMKLLAMFSSTEVKGGRAKQQQVVRFRPECSAVGNLQELREQGFTLPEPEQGWKSAWKLPCLFDIEEEAV